MSSTADTVNSISDKRHWKIWVTFLALSTSGVIFYLLNNSKPHISLFWVFGLVLGVILQRSRFCLASVMRSCLISRDTRSLEGMMGGIFIATIGFSIIMFRMMPRPGPGFIRSAAVVSPFGWHLVLGGLLFGFGMMLGGGCIVGHLYRLGEGSIPSAIAFTGILLGMGILQFNWPWWWDNYISEQPAIWLPARIGWAGAISLTLAVIIFIYAGLRCVRRPPPQRSSGVCQIAQRESRAGWLVSIFKTDWPADAGWIALGIANVLMYWILARPWTVTGEVMNWSQGMLSLLHFPPPPMQAVPGT